MSKSMTGYARAEHTSDWGVISCELKSVNHRYLELSVRMPELIRFEESFVRNKIKSDIARGKLDCHFQISTELAIEPNLSLNEALLKTTISVANEVAGMLKTAAAIQPLELMRMPGVLLSDEIPQEELQAAVRRALDKALESFQSMRSREGNEMAKAIESRLVAIEKELAEVRRVSPEILERQQQKLRDRLAQIDTETDPGRLETELVLLAQRLDVTEELDRLDAHIIEVRRNLGRNEPIGRRLDFLMQEFNREANTLGSKAQAIESTNAAVELKVLIEQMREQIQNLE